MPRFSRTLRTVLVAAALLVTALGALSIHVEGLERSRRHIGMHPASHVPRREAALPLPSGTGLDSGPDPDPDGGRPDIHHSTIPDLVGQPGAPYPEAPLCATHDPRAYHTLWDAARGCHYDHFHGDDPHSVDDVFGTAYYGWAGGSISYPWQTVNSTTGCLENDCKHTGYVWLVRRDQPCFSQFGTGCVTDFRALVHAMSSAHDTSVRYHSAWVEMRICGEDAPNVCGIFRSGGWQDTGDLMIDAVPVIDYPDNNNRFKLHYAVTGNAHFGTWYSGSPGGEGQRGGFWSVVVEIGDMWGPLDPADPHRMQFFCPDPTTNSASNGSRYQPHLIGLAFPPRFAQLVDPDGDRIANYQGYADRYGQPVTGCTSPGLDCVPLIFENVPMGYEYQSRFDYLEYDILFGRQTSGWIQYQH